MSKHPVKMLSVLLFLSLLAFTLSACGSEAPAGTAAATGTSLSAETSSPGESAPAESASDTASSSPSESAPDESALPKPSKNSDVKTFNGYLADQKCGKAGKDTDGNNMKTHPEKHTVKCLKNKTHAASGYGMYIRQKDGKYKFYKFDEAGNKMVKRYIIDKTEKSDEMKIAVRGTLSGSTINVTTVLKYGLK